MARIVQICNTAFYMQKFLFPLVSELVDSGHKLYLICANASSVELNNHLESRVTCIDFDFPEKASPIAFVKSIRSLSKILKQVKADCVNSHNRNASIVGRIAALRSGAPINLYTAHGFYFHDDQSFTAKFASVCIERILAVITDFTLSQSSEDTSFAVQHSLIKADAIETIGNGISTTHFDPSKSLVEPHELDLPPSDFRLCTTGRIVKQKGFQDLIRAVGLAKNSIPNINLIIIGGNIKGELQPYQEEIESLISQLDLSENVTITGLTDKVRDFLTVSQLFVLPSYREGVPRALIEGMSMSLPVIATNIRGCRQLVREGENGYLYDPKDTVKLAELILLCYRNDNLNAMGEKSREIAVDHWDEKHYVEKQVTKINKLLEQLG